MVNLSTWTNSKYCLRSLALHSNAYCLRSLALQRLHSNAYCLRSLVQRRYWRSPSLCGAFEYFLKYQPPQINTPPPQEPVKEHQFEITDLPWTWHPILYATQPNIAANKTKGKATYAATGTYWNKNGKKWVEHHIQQMILSRKHHCPSSLGNYAWKKPSQPKILFRQ